ncbi:uncharacterized protein LOC128393200 [Panonychus citri]|uniref:uncharacterized protein LOC128393200 n=1 Tax=Panonychus citri TaxID=50023 RepID=UPI002307BD64|nr:uncharacterized protein LOC128393200 [Panonychus citri]XP_053209300.1 uncharacterized protein LOC128393200 [Panonychus citri]
MASSTDGYKDTKDAKDFQEWIEINKSRHETLIDQMSTSSLSSSSSHELINQCGKGLNGVGIKGKKVRFKKKLRRAKDHNLNYRSGYYRGDDRRNGRPSQLCHLVKLFSTFGGLIALVALIFVVVNVQTHIELLQIQLRSLNDHYHGMATTLTALKKKTQDHDSIILTLTSNISACLNNNNNNRLETDGDINPSPMSTSPLTATTTTITTKSNSKILPDLNWLPSQLHDLSFQVNKLSLNVTHCNEKMSTLETRLNNSAQTEDGLTKSFSYVNNKVVENSGKLEHLMGLVGHLVEVTTNLTTSSSSSSTTSDHFHENR